MHEFSNRWLAVAGLIMVSVTLSITVGCASDAPEKPRPANAPASPDESNEGSGH